MLDSVHAFTAIGHRAVASSPSSAWSWPSSIGLIGWRGDRLRSPGSIDSPISREGAFLVNNLLFAGFAFVVLLGTVFPLLVEAVNGNQLTIGGPVLQPDDAADRPGPAVPDGRRTRPAVAQGVGRDCCARGC